jgi:transcriptional regulator with XRE-family HTH domain
MSTFSDRIKKARLEAGLSQEALARAMSELADKKKSHVRLLHSGNRAKRREWRRLIY